MRALRVLHLCSADEVGGAEESLLGLLARLDRGRVLPLLGLPRGGGALAVRARALGLDTVELPLFDPRRNRNPLRLALDAVRLGQARRAVAECVRARGIDRIHANSAKAGLQAAGAPVLCHLRDWNLPRLAQFLLPRRARYVVASAAMEARHRPFAGGRLVRIPNGVDSEFFRPPSGPREPLLLMAARFSPWKRHRFFLELLAAARALRPGLRGAIAGERTELLRPEARSLGIEDAVEWLGAVPRAGMPALYGRALALVHPPADEPFGRVILEAMACATPVLAADSGGPAELLVGGGGTLLPPGDASAFLQAVLSCVDAPAQAQRDGEAGRERALQYGEEPMARAMEAALLAAGEA